MLTTLRIKNLALVSDLTLDLRAGYNVVSGETGAGKSILIGALSLVLGERADRTLIRSGCDTCSVEAVFDISDLRAPLHPFLEESGLEPCEDHLLVLKRTITASGSNRQFINGSPTSLQLLTDLGEWLVDIHGPHDHQSLLSSAKQLAILDALGGLQTRRGQFAALVRRREDLAKTKADLIVDEKTYAQQLDLLRHQATEIETAQLQPDEEARVEQEHRRSHNAARLLQLTQTAVGLLADDDNALSAQMGALGRTLQELQRLDNAAAPLISCHEQAASQLEELRRALSHYADRVDLDPSRLQELEERLNLIHALKRKYGSTVTEVLAFGNHARQKLQALEQRDAELRRINLELQQLDGELERTGRDLSASRRQLIPKLCQAAARQLADLGFKQSRFDVTITSCSKLFEPGPQFTLTGLDTIEFQFAPNIGEPARPLRAIASSGEMARIMLALKTVLAAEDEIPVLVFDEVDANVGGETARAVGEKMRQIAGQRQVLCVTHLAPVAALAHAHFVVTKEVKGGRTISEIQLLDDASRLTELARMLGGQSEAARRHAAELLGR